MGALTRSMILTRLGSTFTMLAIDQWAATTSCSELVSQSEKLPLVDASGQKYAEAEGQSFKISPTEVQLAVLGMAVLLYSSRMLQ